jgi:hypothetical protein
MNFKLRFYISLLYHRNNLKMPNFIFTLKLNTFWNAAVLCCRDCPHVPGFKCFSILRIPSSWDCRHVSPIMAYHLKLKSIFTRSTWEVKWEDSRSEASVGGQVSDSQNPNRMISRKESSYNFLICCFLIKSFI